MIRDLIELTAGDQSWTVLAVLVLIAVGLALIILSLTAWRRPQ
ncbi:hypothetical protein [Kitasatospora sp. NPDC047058]